ncbi:MAG: hypothetical protein SGPRY_011610 [Prymnesium sp.]
MKTLSFHEDERPAYLGTFTRPSVAVAVASTPVPEPFLVAWLGHFLSVMEVQQGDSPVFWQVDSEAEWAPEGDVEDLGSEVDRDEQDNEQVRIVALLLRLQTARMQLHVQQPL